MKYIKTVDRDVPVYFGWRQLTECQRLLKKAILKSGDLDKAEEDMTSEEKESALDLSLDMFESICVIASVGLKAGNKREYEGELTDREVDDLIDENPSLAWEVYDYFNEKYKVFLSHASPNGQQLKEKKPSQAAT